MTIVPNTSPASIGILVVLIVLLQASSTSSALLSRALDQRQGRPFSPTASTATTASTSLSAPSAPPGVVFMVVWPVLYLLAAVALWLQIVAPSSTTSTGVQWCGVVLMALQLVAGFAWMPVFIAGSKKAATWLVLGMLIVSVTGVVLVAATNGTAAALWAPYIAWLVFALVLSAQVNARDDAMA